jgi:hypothetical protein
MFFACVGVTLIFGLIFMLFMRYCSGIVTWLMILIFMVGLAALGWVCYDRYNTVSLYSVLSSFLIMHSQEQSVSNASQGAATSSNGTTTATQVSSNSYVNSIANNRKALLGLAIFFWGLLLVFAVIICCIYSRIQLAIAILKVEVFGVVSCL